MKKLTREWVRKAEADYRAAAKLGRGKETFHDQLCFLCQQSTEKYLKALLAELAQPILRTHVLRNLLDLLSSHYPSLRAYRRGLTFLTRFAVGTRYSGDDATNRQSLAALRYAGQVRQEVRALLGIRQPRKKPL